MKKILITLCGLVALQGCSSVDQPVAQRALVEHEYVHPASAVDSELARALSSVQSNTSSNLNGQQITFGETFFAASGLTCRMLTYISQQERLYCRRTEMNWFEVNKVISEYSQQQESGAK